MLYRLGLRLWELYISRFRLFDYWFDDPQSIENSTVWELNSLSPLAPGLLTPFSYSVVAEIMRRGWFQYYDRLRFEPMPGARLVRQHRGYTYLNSSISAALDANVAAIEPCTIHVNNVLFPLAKWEKPGLLGGIKAARSQKQVDVLLKEFSNEVVVATQKAKAWYENLLTLKWSQADILQVMEQIERVGSDCLMIFFAAQHNLGLLYNRLFWATQAQAPYPLNMQLIVAASSDAAGLIEQEMIDQIQAIRASLASSGKLADFRARLANCARENTEGVTTEGSTRSEPVDPILLEVIKPFLERFGHRGLGEGEVRNPRWAENPILLCQVIASGAEVGAGQRATVATEAARKILLAKIDAKGQKQAQKWLQQIPELLRLQSLSLHAFSYVQAGTRQWALAAAHEAMTDNRLTHPSEIYFYALEEAKEMMTGEWNVSATDEIRAVAAQRRAEYNEWEKVAPSALLMDDIEVNADKSQTSHSPVNVVEDTASGIFVRINPSSTAPPFVENSIEKMIIGLDQIESCSAPLLPDASGVLSANGTFLSPAVSIAARHQTPVRINVRNQFDSLVDEGQTTMSQDGIQQ